MIILLFLSCDSSEDPISVTEPSSELTTAPENKGDEEQEENSTTNPPDLDFEWTTSEKVTQQPGDSDANTVLPNFSRTDINPFSSTYGTDISPQGYLGSVTGWYFIKAT